MRHSIFFIRLVAATFFVIFNYSQLAAQVSCTGDTPFFQVDLSASPTETWLSPSVVRDGSCCGGGSNQVNCLEVEVLLHPDAEGILFEVESGANPGGALFYQVNCEGVPLSSPNNTVCLDGAGPHYISYCKVGNNQNTYSVSSIPAATTSNDIVSTPSCPDTLSITGVDPATITWNSISPGNPGDYNEFLSNLAGTDQGVNGIPFGGYTDVIMTPVDGAPAEILYEVCATPIGGCDENILCDTISVGVFNDLTLEINPQNPTICFGDNGVDLTANVTGGIPPLSYVWNTGENTPVINVQNPGNYSVEVTDGEGCVTLIDNVEVNEITAEIAASAGPDVTTCAEPLPSITLRGAVTGTDSGIWLNGGGTYDPDNVTLGEAGTVYTPSPDEVNAGFVELTLSSTNNLGCPGDSDLLRINLPNFNTQIDSNVIDVSCANANTGAINLEVLNGNLIESYVWSTTETTQDINGLDAGNYSVQIVDVNNCAQNYVFEITEPEPLIFIDCQVSSFPSGDNLSCNGASDGNISVEIDGGVEPYAYQWSNGMTSEDINDVTAGSYELTVTDANGCVLDTTILLSEPSIFTQDLIASTFASGQNISCFGENDGSIDYTVNGGSPSYDFVWNNGETTEDLSNLTEGTYTVTTTDINGCTTDTSVTLTEPEPLTQDITSPTFYSGDNISCFDAADGSIDYTVNGGSPNYNYIWSNGASSEDIDNLSVGIYNVEVTDINGCTIDTVITLTEPNQLIQNITSPVLAGGFNISCFGANDGSIDYTVEGGTPNYDFSWDNGGTTEDLNSLIAGTYNISVTDMNGCTLDTSIILTEPPLLEVDAEITSDYNGQNISCYNASDGIINSQVNGGVPNYNVFWINSLEDTIGTSIELTNISPGQYTIYVEDDLGCTANDVVNVTQPDSVIAVINVLSDFNGMAVNCQNTNDGSIEVETTGGTPNYSYVWNTTPNAYTSTLNDLSVGTYIVAVTDVNNCSSSDTVTLDAHPVPSAIIGEGDEACEGEPVSFNVTSDIGTTAIWNFENGLVFNGMANNDVYFNDVGCFDVVVTVTSDEGCSNSQSLNNHLCINPLPYADFSQSRVDVTTFSPIVQFWNQSSGEASVQWDFGDGNTSYNFNPYNEFPNDSSGTYQIQLIATSQYGCRDSVTSLVVVEEKLLIYVPNTFTPDNDDYNQVFLPILTQGFDPYNYELLIFNRWGEILFESHDSDVGWTGHYGGQIVKDGTYLWTINVKDKNGIMQQFKGHVNLLR